MNTTINTIEYKLYLQYNNTSSIATITNIYLILLYYSDCLLTTKHESGGSTPPGGGGELHVDKIYYAGYYTAPSSRKPTFLLT